MQPRGVAAADDTWQFEMNCTFPGPTATYIVLCGLGMVRINDNAGSDVFRGLLRWTSHLEVKKRFCTNI